MHACEVLNFQRYLMGDQMYILEWCWKMKKNFVLHSLQTSLFTMGEGGHNYHHTFPQDYRTSEFPICFNWTKPIIDMFAILGWAYDRKVVSEEVSLISELFFTSVACTRTAARYLKAAVTMLRPMVRPTDGKIDLVTMHRPMGEILA